MFRLSLRYKDQELCAREDDTDDPVVAMFNCRQFQSEVLPIIKQGIPALKRITDSDIERRVDRVDAQLPLFATNGNGRHV